LPNLSHATLASSPPGPNDAGLPHAVDPHLPFEFVGEVLGAVAVGLRHKDGAIGAAAAANARQAVTALVRCRRRPGSSRSAAARAGSEL